jgi:hypothetical protein
MNKEGCFLKLCCLLLKAILEERAFLRKEPRNKKISRKLSMMKDKNLYVNTHKKSCSALNPAAFHKLSDHPSHNNISNGYFNYWLA